jgi:hypothetical protein
MVRNEQKGGRIVFEPDEDGCWKTAILPEEEQTVGKAHGGRDLSPDKGTNKDMRNKKRRRIKKY